MVPGALVRLPPLLLSVPWLLTVPPAFTMVEGGFIKLPAKVLSVPPELTVMVPVLYKVMSLNVSVAGPTVKVSPESIVKDVTLQNGSLHEPPIAAQDDGPEMVPPTAYASWIENAEIVNKTAIVKIPTDSLLIVN